MDATFETAFESVSDSNSKATANNQGVNVIQVNPGNRIPGVPQHTLKLRIGYEITPSWTVGTNIISSSSRYARGDENNQDNLDEE